MWRGRERVRVCARASACSAIVRPPRAPAAAHSTRRHPDAQSLHAHGAPASEQGMG